MDHDPSLREYLLDSLACNDRKREDHPEFQVETLPNLASRFFYPYSHILNF